MQNALNTVMIIAIGHVSLREDVVLDVCYPF